MTIKVPTKHLKAAILAAGKQDVRYYLNGVLVEVSPEETRCVATTGTIGCVLRSPGQAATLAIILPRDVVEAAIKMKRAEAFISATPDGHWLMNDTIRFKPVDGTFPPYRRIFKGQVSGQAGRGLNPELFALFGKMAQALGVTPLDVTTHSDGASAAMVTIEGHPEFAGIIAPLNFTKAMGDGGLGVQGWAGQ